MEKNVPGTTKGMYKDPEVRKSLSVGKTQSRLMEHGPGRPEKGAGPRLHKGLGTKVTGFTKAQNRLGSKNVCFFL